MVLEAFAGGIPRRIAPEGVPLGAKRLGNGVVQRALVEVFLEAGRPMGVGEALLALEVLLGRSVSRGSVNSCLSTGAVRLDTVSSVSRPTGAALLRRRVAPAAALLLSSVAGVLRVR